MQLAKLLNRDGKSSVGRIEGNLIQILDINTAGFSQPGGNLGR
jgi:hypothetical protein